MNAKNKLRNSLVGKLQQMSADKLAEIHTFLEKMGNKPSSKEKTTLQFGGIWKNLDDDFYDEITEKLHQNRSN